MNSPAEPARASSFGRNAAVVTVGAMVANVAAYLVHLPASRWFGPELYGEFAALLSVQLIAAVPTLALQVVVARDRVLGTPVARLRQIGRRTALWLFVLLLVVAWPVAEVLSTSPAAVLAAAAAAPALCVLSVELGLLQAGQRFARFAWLSALLGLAKAVPAVAMLAATGAVAPTLAAEAAGISAVAVLARVLAARGTSNVGVATHPRTELLVDSPPHTDLRSVAHAAQVQLALIALTTADLLLARALLPPVEAGHYALGAIATKVAFWLPAAIATVLFPQMARPGEHAAARRRALGAVAGIGALLAAAAALAAPLVPAVVGADYAPVVHWLWLFTAIGAVQSLIQVLLLAGIAAHRSREAAVAWAGVALLAAVPLSAHWLAADSGLGTWLLTVPGLACWALTALVLTTSAAALTSRTTPRR